MHVEIKNNISRSLVDLLNCPTGKEGTIKLRSSRNTQSWSYEDLKNASLRLTSKLHEQGIKPSERVILWGPNNPQWVMSYFGILRTGAVVVPFDINAEISFLDKIITATDPRLIIAGDLQKDKLPADVYVPVMEMSQVDKLPESKTLKDIRISPEDLAEIVFTSGTTGKPKGVMLSHGNILANIEAVRKVITITPEHKLLSILPLSHMFEMTGGLLVPMASKASIVYPETITPSTLFQAIHDEEITCMAVVPQVLQLFKKGIEQEVTKQGKKEQWDLLHKISPHLPIGIRRILFSSLHKKMGGKFDFFVCGGAHLDPNLARCWENLGIKVVQGYGMTEASPIVTCDSLSERKHNFVGKPIPGVDVEIARDGEILVRGSNIMNGYWKDSKATAEVMEHDWYHTGDLGILESGRLKLLGRKKYMIVLSNGLNVYPEDIEMALKQQGIKDVIVFSQKDKNKEELHAVLLLDGEMDARSLVKAANGQLAAHQKVQKWTIWEESDFPRTHTLKPKREEIIKKLSL